MKQKFREDPKARRAASMTAKALLSLMEGHDDIALAEAAENERLRALLKTLVAELDESHAG